MSESRGNKPVEDESGAPERLALRARPAPVTRINRKVLIGASALLLLLIAGLVMVALQAPTLRVEAPRELFNVERKAITDGLERLPLSYDAVRPVVKADTRTLPPGVPRLSTAVINDKDDGERVEAQRLARLAGQAREAQVFFRLALKPPPEDKAGADNRDAAAPTPQPSTPQRGDLATLTALHAGESTRALSGDTDLLGGDTSDQARKHAFLKAEPEAQIYNPHALQMPASPYQLMAGTVIAASLVTGLNSDLPGFVIAHITENVYDSVSGKYLLIPQGARLVGKYDNIVAFGQERALLVWQRIILPDGSSVVIDNLPATDTGGYAGLADEVDLHTWKLLKGVALATVLGFGSELAFNSSDSDLVRALQSSTQSTANRAGQRLVERQLNVQPTITVRPGWPLRVIVHKDIVLRPYRAPPTSPSQLTRRP